MAKQMETRGMCKARSANGSAHHRSLFRTGTGGGLGRTLQMSAAADMGNIEEEHRGFQIEYATVHAR